MDYCSAPSFASGGFIADSRFDGGTVINGSQQQWLVRNSTLDGWTNGVGNQVFSGVEGAPAECFPAQASCGGPYTTLAKSPVTREAPYLYVDSKGERECLRSVGPNKLLGHVCSRRSDTRHVDLDRPVLRRPTVGLGGRRSTEPWGTGRNLILTPGVYHLDESIAVTRPDTVVLGLGFPTLIPTNGNAAMTTASAKGNTDLRTDLRCWPAHVAGIAASRKRPRKERQRGVRPVDSQRRLLPHRRRGALGARRRRRSLVVNSNNVILDDIWAWRADHGNGVGWTINTADTGVVVNGDNVTAYGLFVEHYQKYETIWNGNGGTDIFFQNEMPYDPPSQAAWMEAPGVDGWAAFKVGSDVTSFNGYGMDSYSFFNQGVNIYAANAFEVPPTLPPGVAFSTTCSRSSSARRAPAASSTSSTAQAGRRRSRTRTSRSRSRVIRDDLSRRQRTAGRPAPGPSR